MLVSSTAVLADPPPGNGASCVNFHCGVGAVDPGPAGSPGAGAPPSVPPISGTAADASSGNHTSGSGADTGGGTVSVPACTEQPMSPQPAPTSPWWEGQTGRRWSCRAVGVHGWYDPGDVYVLLGAGPAFRGERSGRCAGSPARGTSASAESRGAGSAGVSADPDPETGYSFRSASGLGGSEYPCVAVDFEGHGSAGDRDGGRCFGDGHARR